MTSYRIEDTRVLDDSRILFRLGREEYYVNRLARSCAGLKLAQGFAYDLRGGSAICRGDVIIGLDGTTTGRPCLLGEFEKVVRDSSR